MEVPNFCSAVLHSLSSTRSCSELWFLLKRSRTERAEASFHTLISVFDPVNKASRWILSSDGLRNGFMHSCEACLQDFLQSCVLCGWWRAVTDSQVLLLLLSAGPSQQLHVSCRKMQDGRCECMIPAEVHTLQTDLWPSSSTDGSGSQRCSPLSYMSGVTQVPASQRIFFCILQHADQHSQESNCQPSH